ncbi:hypothetical protein D3C85_1423600 [compost metagenome]
MVEGQHGFARFAHGQRGAQDHLQLADVARPVIAAEQAIEIVVQDHGGGAQYRQHATDQRAEIFAFAQGREHHTDAIDPVEQVLAKVFFLHQTLEVAVGGADQRDIDVLLFASAQGRDLAILQHPQQSGLQGQWHVADFIEEQGAAMGLLQAPDHAAPA